jgi:hypothetical protein
LLWQELTLEKDNYRICSLTCAYEYLCWYTNTNIVLAQTQLQWLEKAKSEVTVHVYVIKVKYLYIDDPLEW